MISEVRMTEVLPVANGGTGKDKSKAPNEGFLASLLAAFRGDLRGIHSCVQPENRDNLVLAHGRVDSVSEGPVPKSPALLGEQPHGTAWPQELHAVLDAVSGTVEDESPEAHLGVQAFGLDLGAEMSVPGSAHEVESASAEVFRTLATADGSKATTGSGRADACPETPVAIGQLDETPIQADAEPRLVGKAGMTEDASTTQASTRDETNEVRSLPSAPKSETSDEEELDRRNDTGLRTAETGRRPADHSLGAEDFGLDPNQASEPVQPGHPAVAERFGAEEPPAEVLRLDLRRCREVAESLYRESLKNLPRSIELRLDPPELGKVSVLLVSRGENVTVKFIASSQEAQRAIEQATPDLARSLQEQGLVLSGAFVEQGSEDARPHAWERSLAGKSGVRINGIKSVANLPETNVCFRRADSALDYFA